MKKSDKHEDMLLDQILGEKLLAMRLEQAPPQETKKAVFSTLDTLNFFSEVADLFTGKFALAELAILEAVGASPERPSVGGEAEEEK